MPQQASDGTPHVGAAIRDSGDGPFDTDAYAAFRPSGHAVADLGFGEFTLFVGYDDVRAAARDWSRFTSNTPFEVPIPPEHGVRPVRQIPIEADPPDHTDYRAITARFFSRAAAERHAPRIAALIDDILASALARGNLDVVRELALPVVNHGLAATLGRPPAEAERWLSWGVHVFAGDSEGKSSNAELNSYLEEAVDAACRRPGDDFFGTLATATFHGRPLTRDEMLGYGNLVFAGGRDTVVTAIAASCWYFATHADEWARLQASPDLVRPAIEEILRLSSPLAFIGRHITEPCAHAGAHLQPGALIALGFAAANRDPAAFDAPDECRIDRHPNRHIAFGHGPHTCSGANLARMELRVTVERLLRAVGAMEVTGEPRYRRIRVAGREVPDGIEALEVAVSPR